MGHPDVQGEGLRYASVGSAAYWVSGQAFLAEKLRSIAGSLFSELQEESVEHSGQVCLIGSQVDPDEIVGGRAESQPDMELPFGAVKQVAGSRQHSCARSAVKQLQLMIRIDPESFRVAAPGGISRKITICKIVCQLGFSKECYGQEDKKEYFFHYSTFYTLVNPVGEGFVTLDSVVWLLKMYNFADSNEKR